MRRMILMAGAVLALPAWAADPASGLDDRHLLALPRSAAEAARVAEVTAPATDFRTAEPFEAMPGGAATGPVAADADAFSHPSAGLSAEGKMDFQLGNALFRKLWVAAPASTRGSDGLGPLYNARSCENCHVKDGRGHPPAGPEDSLVSMALRLSVPGGSGPAAIADWLATEGDPVYGGQLQDFAAPGQAAEGRLEVSYTDLPVVMGDGTEVVLRAPAYAVSGLAFGPLAPGAMLSARVAPPMIGLGLLEAIPAADILAHADPEDRDGDGISGRPAVVVSPETGAPMLGRFGLKGGAATLRDQSAAAFALDMGLSNPLHPAPWGDCTEAEAACRAAPHGQEPGIRDGLEVDGDSLDLLAFYTRNLAVPRRADAADPQVLAGKAAFYGAGCPACHVPKFVTARLEGRPEQSFQLIWPYSDLLLHDMGPGLADNRPEGRATGQEWKTPPLWGLGATALVAGGATYLHDGRARDLVEAILWHGGEAAAARDAFAALPAPDRDALIAFLESL